MKRMKKDLLRCGKYKSSRQVMFSEEGVLKNFAIFTWKKKTDPRKGISVWILQMF